jgi:hypothetical protein
MPEQVLNTTGQAPTVPPARHAFAASAIHRVRQAVVACVAVLLAPTACVLPPSVDTTSAHVVPALLMRKELADPTVLIPVVVDRAQLNKAFDVFADHPGIDELTLRYYWYYDYSKTLPSLDQAVVCATAQNRCVLFPCSLLLSQEDSHRLMVVVSDLPLRVTDDQAHGPFDFPKGAHFDSLQWDINLKGVCP